MEKYKIDSINEAIDNPEIIYAMIQKHQLNIVPEIQKLNRYYRGQNDIAFKTVDDPSRPNNRTSSNWGKYIVDSITTYFIGKPVSYSSSDTELLKEVQDIFNYNKEQSHNIQLATTASITGYGGYELVYLDEEGQICFDDIDPEQVFMIYDNSVRERFIGAVRFYHTLDHVTGDKSMSVELYTLDTVYHYIEGDDGLILNREEPNYFDGLQVIPFYPNPEQLGHFKTVIGKIDAYDMVLNQELDYRDSIADAYLMITGVNPDNLTDIDQMRNRRVLLLEEGASAQWLSKSSNSDTYKMLENLKSEIHQLSMVPDLTSKVFGGEASSGVAIQFKMHSLEGVCQGFERYFKHSLERRLKLIISFINKKKAKNYDARDIQMKFKRNVPSNIEQEIKQFTQLKGGVSDYTLLNGLSIVEDVSEEIERLKLQAKDDLFSFEEYQQFGTEDQQTEEE